MDETNKMNNFKIYKATGSAHGKHLPLEFEIFNHSRDNKICSSPDIVHKKTSVPQRAFTHKKGKNKKTILH